MENIVSTTVVNSNSPELLRNEIDSRIVKIRPMATPIDQISRHAATRHAGSMVVEYYKVDSKPFLAKVVAKVYSETSANENGTISMDMHVNDASPFAKSETIMISGLRNNNDIPVTAYITRIENNHLYGFFTCADKDGKVSIPDINPGATVVRMGRAAHELDIQTVQFQAIPKKGKNVCQIFKSQIEQSTLVKLSNKEVGWTFSDQEEAAIIDMRQGMERNFMFGNMMNLNIGGDNNVLLTGGIWQQAGKEYTYTKDALSNDTMVSICREAFTGANGSSRKLLIAGSGFIEALHKLNSQRIMTADDKMTRWGLDFTTYVSKFGTLYVLLSETFDQCGHCDNAMIIDPEYITKYSHIPFNTEKLDLRASGIRNTDAIVITEASCLVLRYPDAHMRIIAQ